MKKHILLIDDNKYLLDVFVIRLTMSLKNYKILTARNGKRGIEILKSARVDLVLTDLDMPEMDGYQFIEYAQKHFPEIPVYAMSNDCSLEIGQSVSGNWASGMHRKAISCGRSDPQDSEASQGGAGGCTEGTQNTPETMRLC